MYHRSRQSCNKQRAALTAHSNSRNHAIHRTSKRSSRPLNSHARTINLSKKRKKITANWRVDKKFLKARRELSPRNKQKPSNKKRTSSAKNDEHSRIKSNRKSRTRLLVCPQSKPVPSLKKSSKRRFTFAPFNPSSLKKQAPRKQKRITSTRSTNMHNNNSISQQNFHDPHHTVTLPQDKLISQISRHPQDNSVVQHTSQSTSVDLCKDSSPIEREPSIELVSIDRADPLPDKSDKETEFIASKINSPHLDDRPTRVEEAEIEPVPDENQSSSIEPANNDIVTASTQETSRTLTKSTSISVMVPKVLSITAVTVSLSEKLVAQETIAYVSHLSTNINLSSNNVIPIQQRGGLVQSALLYIHGCMDYMLEYASLGSEQLQGSNIRYMNTSIPFACCTKITFLPGNKPIFISTDNQRYDPDNSNYAAAANKSIQCNLLSYTLDGTLSIREDQQGKKPIEHHSFVQLNMALQIKLELVQIQNILLYVCE